MAASCVMRPGSLSAAYPHYLVERRQRSTVYFEATEKHTATNFKVINNHLLRPSRAFLKLLNSVVQTCFNGNIVLVLIYFNEQRSRSQDLLCWNLFLFYWTVAILNCVENFTQLQTKHRMRRQSSLACISITVSR